MPQLTSVDHDPFAGAVYTGTAEQVPPKQADRYRRMQAAGTLDTAAAPGSAQWPTAQRRGGPPGAPESYWVDQQGMVHPPELSPVDHDPFDAVLARLPDELATMRTVRRGPTRVILENDTSGAVVTLDYEGQAKRWLMMAYDRPGGGTVDSAPPKDPAVDIPQRGSPNPVGPPNIAPDAPSSQPGGTSTKRRPGDGYGGSATLADPAPQAPRSVDEIIITSSGEARELRSGVANFGAQVGAHFTEKRTDDDTVRRQDVDRGGARSPDLSAAARDALPSTVIPDGLAGARQAYSPKVIAFYNRVQASGSAEEPAGRRSANRIRLVAPDTKAVIRLDLDGQSKKWLMTAYEPGGRRGGGTTGSAPGALRTTSGANAPEPEVKRARRAYFRHPGESSKVEGDRARVRERFRETAIRAAGAAYIPADGAVQKPRSSLAPDKELGYSAKLHKPQLAAAKMFAGASARGIKPGQKVNSLIPENTAQFTRIPAGSWVLDDDGTVFQKKP